jgi:hypothetical protein
MELASLASKEGYQQLKNAQSLWEPAETCPLCFIMAAALVEKARAHFFPPTRYDRVAYVEAEPILLRAIFPHTFPSELTQAPEMFP